MFFYLSKFIFISNSAELQPIICDLLVSIRSEESTDIAALGRFYTFLVEGGQIESSFDSFLTYLRNETWDSYASGERKLRFLKCNEISLFLTTSQALPPLTDVVSTDLWIDLCQQVFGDSYTLESVTAGNAATNIAFGGTNPNVDHVYITYGGFDPNRLVGPSENLNPLSPVHVIPRAQKRFDIFPPSDLDRPDIRAVKEQARLFVHEWISN